MSIAFQAYWPAWWLLLLPFVWWVRRRTLTNFGGRQLAFQAAVRSLVVVAVVGALMEPVVTRGTRAMSVVYALDASASVSREGFEAAMAWIDEANRLGRPDHWQLIVFGRTARAVRRDAARQAGLFGSLAGLDRSATNLEAALVEARQRLAPGHTGRIALVTDGHATAGRLWRALDALGRDGVPVFTRPIESPPVQDAWIEAVELPGTVAADEPFDARIRIGSRIVARAAIAVTAGGRSLAALPVVLQPGTTAVTVPLRVPSVGSTMLDVDIALAGDVVPANDRFRAHVAVAGRPSVLYVEGRPDAARYLHDALEGAGIDVDLVPASRLPTRAGSLSAYGALILSDVAPESLTADQMGAVSGYVEDLGGGLIMAGGEAVHGADGYSGTPIEDALPVTFTIKDRPPDLALVIVLDRSWSMDGPKIELSKEAAKAAIDVLADEHRVGLVVFNDSLEWTVPIARASERERIKERISRITPAGHTNMFPAIEQAHLALVGDRSRLKHVIVLSDGRTYPDDYEGLVGRMVAGRITVSTIAVGREADRELLANIARWGKGRTYYIEDANEVPQVFIRETEQAANQTLVEVPFRPILRKRAEVLKGLDLAVMPPLRGYSGTRAKETAEVILASDRDQPILARWQYGLGRTVLFASDVKNRWASEWLGWPGYGKFWSQIVRDTLRLPAGGGRSVSIERQVDGARITVLAPDDSAPVLPGELVDPAGRRSALMLSMDGPGRYASDVTLAAEGDYRLTIAPGTAGALTRVIPENPSAETRHAPAAVELLKTISRDSGGRFDPSIAQLFARPEKRAVRPFDLAPALAGIALGLWVLDLLLRRIRFGEPLRAQLGGAEVAAAAGLATRS